MKQFILIMLSLIACNVAYGQYDEFKIQPNGLIYDEATMNKLGSIVDSLNVRFRTCDLSHPYYSLPQGEAYFVSEPSAKALALIRKVVSFAEFKKQFPDLGASVWVIQYRYRNYRDKKIIEYTTLPDGTKAERSLWVNDRKENNKTTGWVVGDEGTDAVYLVNLQSQMLPYDYARLVQYADCMVDTTTEIYFPKAKYAVYQTVQGDSKAGRFVKWASKFPGKPEYPDYNTLHGEAFDEAYAKYLRKHAEWDSLRMASLDEKVKKPYWKSLLMEARDEALASGNSDSNIEFYIARYLSKAEALQLKRSRKVMGNCSQDQSPRYHAMGICMLAAETAQWDIFLRSHLDIMNDRFERQSDGSYAWGARKTYLKELEQLNIQATDLMLGTCLRVQNVSDHHYWGSIGRVGRALADAADKDKLEAQILQMIKDDKLDTYNRLLLAYLLNNYAHNLDDDNRKNACKKTLDETMDQLSPPLKAAWEKTK
ncbi:MAG: hypothetical protein ACOYXT_08330 [Bacteroidota bacterium]